MSYEAEQPPITAEELPEFLARELKRIAASFESIENIVLVELNVAPARPRTGMVVLADGTNWNPGSGVGFYGYSGGAWTFLG